jgi:hypothetical protein
VLSRVGQLERLFLEQGEFIVVPDEPSTVPSKWNRTPRRTAERTNHDGLQCNAPFGSMPNAGGRLGQVHSYGTAFPTDRDHSSRVRLR